MQGLIGGEAGPFVAASETECCSILSGRLDRGLLILCDHADNAFPGGYGTLGLGPPDLERHIAYDIGAAAVVRHVAKALGAPAVLTRYSRLLIDCNRGLDDPTLVMRLSDGSIIPGNRCLDAGEIKKRIARFYVPYHDAIDGHIHKALGLGAVPAILSVHSFTETWRGTPRPWHAGVLWDSDPRLAQPLLDALEATAGLTVGDNEPYSGRLEGDSMWRHGTTKGLAHAIVEIRQDLIRTAAGQETWGELMARIMKDLLARDDLRHNLHTIRHYGPHAVKPDAARAAAMKESR